MDTTFRQSDVLKLLEDMRPTTLAAMLVDATDGKWRYWIRAAGVTFCDETVFDALVKAARKAAGE